MNLAAFAEPRSNDLDGSAAPIGSLASQTTRRPVRHVRVTWPACHALLVLVRLLCPLRTLSRDAFGSISRSKLTTSFSVLGYNSPERQVCQRPSYSVRGRSVEGHYRLLSDCNRPRVQLHARASSKGSERISDFVCTARRGFLAALAVKAAGKCLAKLSTASSRSLLSVALTVLLVIVTRSRARLLVFSWKSCELPRTLRFGLSLPRPTRVPSIYTSALYARIH